MRRTEQFSFIPAVREEAEFDEYRWDVRRPQNSKSGLAVRPGRDHLGLTRQLMDRQVRKRSRQARALTLRQIKQDIGDLGRLLVDAEACLLVGAIFADRQGLRLLVR